MLNLLMMVPESVGWALVGASAMVCCLLALKVSWALVEMWKSYHEPDEDEDEDEEVSE